MLNCVAWMQTRYNHAMQQRRLSIILSIVCLAWPWIVWNCSTRDTPVWLSVMVYLMIWPLIVLHLCLARMGRVLLGILVGCLVPYFVFDLGYFHGSKYVEAEIKWVTGPILGALAGAAWHWSTSSARRIPGC